MMRAMIALSLVLLSSSDGVEKKRIASNVMVMGKRRLTRRKDRRDQDYDDNARAAPPLECMRASSRGGVEREGLLAWPGQMSPSVAREQRESAPRHFLAQSPVVPCPSSHSSAGVWRGQARLRPRLFANSTREEGPSSSSKCSLVRPAIKTMGSSARRHH